MMMLAGFLVFSALLPLALAAQDPLQSAVRLAATGRLTEAEQILRKLEQGDPQNAEVLYRLGLVLLREGKHKEAGMRLEAASRLSPESPLVWLTLAQVKLRQGNTAEAARAAARARSLARRDEVLSKALLLYDVEAIQHHLEAGQAQEAIELARQAVVRENAAVFRNLLGKAYALRNNAVEAVQELQEAIRLDPNQAAYYLDLAAVLLDHRTPEPAVVILGNAAQRFPKNAEVVRLLGVAYLGKGQTREALEAFLHAIVLDPDLEISYASLETLLPEAGDLLPEITRRLSAFSDQHPSSPVGHYLLALVSAEQAELRLRRAIAVAPAFWPAHFELHKILKQQGKWKDAEAALEKVVSLNPNYPQAHYSLAEVFLHLGDRARASQERELHHKLVAAQRAAEEKRRQEAPKLDYRLVDR